MSAADIRPLAEIIKEAFTVATRDEIEREMYRIALLKYPSAILAARYLGVDRQTVYNRLRTYRWSLTEFKAEKRRQRVLNLPKR